MSSTEPNVAKPSQNHASHYRPPVIHVIGSRPAESYVKFGDNHVTWDKLETRDNHVTKPKSNGRHVTRMKPWKLDSAMTNGPIGNQRLHNYKQLDSESSDNAISFHGNNPAGYYDDDFSNESSTLAAHRHKDIALIYPNVAARQNRLNDNLEASSRFDDRPSSARKLNMKIVNGHMIVTQNSLDDSHTFKLPRHESYMFVSLLVCSCFNCPVGTIALCLSIKSQNLFDNGHRRRAKILANISLVISMIGMITGVFTILAMVFYMAHLQEQKKL